MKARLARWVSILFDSSVLSLIVFPAIGWHTARLQGILWALGTLVIITGIPLAYIIVGQKLGWVADWELSRREDRPRFILVSLSSDLGFPPPLLRSRPSITATHGPGLSLLGHDHVHHLQFLEN